MPLFFLISGFFTAMLWRKRGLRALLAHRFQRIFLPMILGLLTIIPTTWIVSGYVKSAASEEPGSLSAGVAVGSSALPDIWAAAATDDTDLVRVEIRQDEVRRGREQIAEMLGETIDARIAQAFGAKAGSEETFRQAGLAGLVRWLTYFPLFGHLWFLWFLCWLVVGFAAWVTIARVVGLRRPPRWVSLSIWRYAWLLPLTAIPQFFMGQDGNGFGPDTSTGLFTGCTSPTFR